MVEIYAFSQMTSQISPHFHYHTTTHQTSYTQLINNTRDRKSCESGATVTALVTVDFSFGDELEHRNRVRKGSAQQPEDGRWPNDNRLAWEKATIAGFPHSG